MAQDLQLAAAFKAAIPYLARKLSEEKSSDRTEFICHALWNAKRAGKIKADLMERARGIVMKRLDGCGTLNTWMEEKIGCEAVQTDQHNNDQRKMQATRLAWLNSLVEEFS